MAAPGPAGGWTSGLPALDEKDLHCRRVTGTHRLVITASEFGLDETTIGEVVTAAFDLGGGFGARSTAGFAAVCAAGDVVNGTDWTCDVLRDVSVRQRWHDRLKSRALVQAAAKFPRIPFHEREEAVDDVDIYLNHLFEVVKDAEFGNTGIKVSTWDSPSSWNVLIPLRLNGAAARYDRWYWPTEQGPSITSLDGALEFGDAALERGADDLRFGQIDEGIVWGSASAVFSSGRQTVVDGCRAGSQRERMQVVCAATALVLSWGTVSPEIRDGFTDPAGKKVVSWWALWEICSDTWGRYQRNAVPTDAVLREMADAIDPADPNAGFFRAVEGRARDLNGTDRVLHLVTARVTNALRAAE